MRYVVFNRITGDIIERAFCSDDKAALMHFANNLLIDAIGIDLEEYDSQPEIFDEVDLLTKHLKDAPLDKVKARHPEGEKLTSEQIASIIAERKQRLGRP